MSVPSPNLSNYEVSTGYLPLTEGWTAGFSSDETGAISEICRGMREFMPEVSHHFQAIGDFADLCGDGLAFPGAVSSTFALGGAVQDFAATVSEKGLATADTAMAIRGVSVKAADAVLCANDALRVMSERGMTTQKPFVDDKTMTCLELYSTVNEGIDEVRTVMNMNTDSIMNPQFKQIETTRYWSTIWSLCKKVAPITMGIASLAGVVLASGVLFVLSALFLCFSAAKYFCDKQMESDVTEWLKTLIR